MLAETHTYTLRRNYQPVENFGSLDIGTKYLVTSFGREWAINFKFEEILECKTTRRRYKMPSQVYGLKCQPLAVQ